MPTIRNPVLPGFRPDPSFIRVGDDYYLATSTFEWHPGVALHHSRDLVHWRPIGHALTRPDQLDLHGTSDSAGVWAPSLSHADGKFWLIHTNVRNRLSNFKDVGVYLSTADHILGPWSKPVLLNGIGFDPSLFHDDDGRKWLANIQWDFRKGKNRFGGIVIQEYDPVAQRLVGPVTSLLQKKELTEGPNLYKKDGWYYLMLAEGGTGWNHGISLARSRSLTGPYELDPQTSLLTTRDDFSIPLQKAGHGEIVETQAGEWYLAHLASRPLGEGEDRRCVLGRETCLQKLKWPAGEWPRLAHGGHHPLATVEAPDLPPAPWPAVLDRNDFDEPRLGPEWQTLRAPADENWLSLQARPGWLRLRGRESFHSLFHQSLVAQRLQAFRALAETRLQFEPANFTQMAGLVCWYDVKTHYYLRVTHEKGRGKILDIVLTDDTVYDELEESRIAIGDWRDVYLRAEIDRAALQFSASPDGGAWQKIGPVLDMSKLSDDYGKGLHFSGAMVGLRADDINDGKATADFDYFELRHDFTAGSR